MSSVDEAEGGPLASLGLQMPCRQLLEGRCGVRGPDKRLERGALPPSTTRVTLCEYAEHWKHMMCHDEEYYKHKGTYEFG